MLMVANTVLSGHAVADPSPTIRPDSRLIYVSQSSGDDANDGLTALSPKKTLASAIGLLRHGQPDWLLLRGGDVWHEGLGGYGFSGRNANEPLVVTTYGGAGLPASVIPSDAGSARPTGDHIVTYNIRFPDTPWDEFVRDGWTVLTPHAETRVIYVSSSEGDDATGVVYDLADPGTADLIGPDPFDPACEVRAFATPAAAYERLRTGQPDWMLLKRGDEWTIEGHTFGENLWKKSGRGPGDGRVVLGAYGSLDDARPFLRTDPTKSGIFTITNTWNPETVKHVVFTGLHLEPNNRQLDQNPTGIRWLAEGSDLLFEDLLVRGYKECAFSSGPKRELALRRCLFLDSWARDSHSQGIFVKNVDGLLVDECLFDHNGWHDTIAGAEPTTFNHNMYISTTTSGVVVRNCISVRASATGCQARTAGEITGNIFQANPFGLNFGWTMGVELPHDDGSVGACIDNIVIDTPDSGYGQWGINVGNMGERQIADIRNNLLISGGDQITGLRVDGENSFGVHGVELAGNVVFGYERPLQFRGTPGVDMTDIVVMENSFHQVDANDKELVQFRDADPTTDMVFFGNRYCSPRRLDRWFSTPSQRQMSIEEWAAQCPESGAVVDTSSFDDPLRDLGAYHGWLGGEPTLDGFISEARRQRRGNWRAAYTADAAGAWIRNGFGMQAQAD